MLKNITAFVFISLLIGCTSLNENLSRGAMHFKQHNYPLAFEQLLPLAEKGNPDAQYAVGYMYYHGRGVPRDIIQAQLWIQKAADQGYPEAVQAINTLRKPNQRDSLITYPEMLNGR